VRRWKFICSSETARASLEIYLQLGNGARVAGKLFAARGRLVRRWKFICSSETARASLENYSQLGDGSCVEVSRVLRS